MSRRRARPAGRRASRPTRAASPAHRRILAEKTTRDTSDRGKGTDSCLRGRRLAPAFRAGRCWRPPPRLAPTAVLPRGRSPGRKDRRREGSGPRPVRGRLRGRRREADPQAAVKEVLARPWRLQGVLAALGAPEKAGIKLTPPFPDAGRSQRDVDAADDLMPHNHLMWALMASTRARRQYPVAPHAGTSKHTAQGALEGDVACCRRRDPLGDEPAAALHGRLHIYAATSSRRAAVVGAETLHEDPSDGQTIREMFERENARPRCGAG